MTHGVDDDLRLGNLVENEIGIGRRRQTANDWVIGTDADIRMNREQAITACIRA